MTQLDEKALEAAGKAYEYPYNTTAMRAAITAYLAAAPASDVEREWQQLNERIAWEFCCFGPMKPDEIGANGGQNWRRYLPKAEQVTAPFRKALAAYTASPGISRPTSRSAGAIVYLIEDKRR